jgi:hypothetical protein
MKKALVAGCLVAGFATTAWASQYWVVLDSNTNRCSIVAERPNAPTTRLVGALPFPTLWGAENAMKTAGVCGSD